MPHLWRSGDSENQFSSFVIRVLRLECRSSGLVKTPFPAELSHQGIFQLIFCIVGLFSSLTRCERFQSEAGPFPLLASVLTLCGKKSLNGWGEMNCQASSLSPQQHGGR